MGVTRAVFSLAAVTTFFACAGTPPPAPNDQSSSAIAIHIDARAPVKIFPVEVDRVLFVQLDERGDSSLTRTNLIPSNYSRDGYFYLLNAPPGRYAAVAAFHSKERETVKLGETFSLGKGVTVWVGTEIVRYDYFTIYLPERLIRLTEVAVQPRRIAFMGEYVVETSVGLEGADDVQSHYFRLLHPGEGRGTVGQLLLGNYNYRGVLHEARQDVQAGERFSRRAAAHLSGVGWAEMLR